MTLNLRKPYKLKLYKFINRIYMLLSGIIDPQSYKVFEDIGVERSDPEL